MLVINQIVAIELSGKWILIALVFGMLVYPDCYIVSKSYVEYGFGWICSDVDIKVIIPRTNKSMLFRPNSEASVTGWICMAEKIPPRANSHSHTARSEWHSPLLIQLKKHVISNELVGLRDGAKRNLFEHAQCQGFPFAPAHFHAAGSKWHNFLISITIKNNVF